MRSAFRFRVGAARQPTCDAVVVEEPLEIRIADEPWIVTMRTPGHDHELVVGLLLAEGLIRSTADLSNLSHCGHLGSEGYGNAINAVLMSGGLPPESPAWVRRGSISSAACGICGRQVIEDILSSTEIKFPPEANTLSVTRIAHLMDSLREWQPTFSRTGGLHAVGIASPAGEYLVVREDIGRHNAVDKAVGRLVLDKQLGTEPRLMIVSGRVSFEIVQKALRAGISTVIGISAVSSLAIAVAERANMTLGGFARSGTFTTYSGGERISDS